MSSDFGLSGLTPIVLQSARYGLSISFLCVTIAFFPRMLAAYLRTKGRSNLRRPQKLACGVEVILALAILPALALHPALITVYLTQPPDTFPWLSDILGGLGTEPYGIVLIGVYLHLPFAYFRVRAIRLEEYLASVSKARQLGHPMVTSWVAFLSVPLLIELIPFFIFLSILAEGMVFVPYMNLGQHSETLGRILLDHLLTHDVTEQTANNVIIVFLVKLVSAFLLYRLVSKYRGPMVRKIHRLFTLASQVTALPRSLNAVSEYSRCIVPVKLFLRLFLVFASGAIAALCLVVICVTDVIVLLIVFKYALSGGAFSWKGIWIEATNASWSVPSLTDTIWANLYVGLVGSLVSLVLFYGITMLVGKRDRWTEKGFSRIVGGALTLLAVVPAALYGYRCRGVLVAMPYLSVPVLLGFIGLFWAMLSTGPAARRALYRLERQRKLLSLQLISYWREMAGYLTKEGAILWGWIFLLLWNDIAIQLFAVPSFYGMSSFLLPLGGHGVPTVIASALAILQLGILLFAIPGTWWALWRTSKSK